MLLFSVKTVKPVWPEYPVRCAAVSGSEMETLSLSPWDFQDSKADVKHRYTKTQAMYLSRKGVLPKELDFFGMNTSNDDDDDEFSDTFGTMDEPEEQETDELFGSDDDDDDDDLFGSDDDDDDDLFGSDDDDDDDDLFGSDDTDEAAPAEEVPHIPVEEYPAEDDDDDDDDDDEDLEALFG